MVCWVFTSGSLYFHLVWLVEIRLVDCVNISLFGDRDVRMELGGGGVCGG